MAAILGPLSLHHPYWRVLLHFITGDTTHLITGRVITTDLLDTGRLGTGKTGGLPMDGSEYGLQVIGNTNP